MRNFVAKAKAGDAKAAKLVLDIVASSAPKTTFSVGFRANQAGEVIPGRPPGGRVLLHPDKPLNGVRQRCAEVLGKEGPCSAEDLADEIGAESADIGRALDDHEWFDRQKNGTWRLTELGRREALA
jgi:hypothetical protein